MNYFFYARPSFVGGVAQIMDLGNTLFDYNWSNSPSQADFLAAKHDWMVVGHDLRGAVIGEMGTPPPGVQHRLL